MVESKETSEPRANPLDELTCFNLYAAARATNRLYNVLLAPWNLTYPQYLVLRLLWARDTATIGEIAKCLMLDSGTTTPLVRRLETHGLVTRTRSSTDERIVTVSLTKRGQALEEDVAGVAYQVGAATGLGAADGLQTIQSLRTINANLAATIAATAQP
ncbi:MarR family transcriptional regulator [Herbiconiux sp. CPCC 205716]|uniref:MarR family transcriptional regulator n=1 Tax=Herbiconiux gentiana TaxID=2970912 RepID=A0ABT2GD36_9MICO|nr:MarR family transcriptional regulator [Herbiconiux gentiana]MCS5714130.1 MarR family transcriptional regulator [Herbiconiux gentiana]